jgi:CheY-like chemotaxis protein
MTTATSVLAFVEDLMFLSRIREAARATGLEVETSRDVASLVATCRQRRPAVIFVDLGTRRLPALEAVAAVRAEPSLTEVPIVGFLGHAQVDDARAAETAGCTRVLARGAFVNELPRLLAEPPKVSSTSR